jgi:hypothetical protein
MQIVLSSKGADTPYVLRSGQFHISDGKLDIALELEISDADDEDNPPEILVRFANLHFHSSPSKIFVRDRHEHWDADDGEPHAYVYSGFHHDKISGWINVHSHDDKQLTADITVVTDDVDRYDETASDNAIVGQIVLSPHPKDEMWGV